MSKLAIFDLDGVLADTSAIHTVALREAVDKHLGSDIASLYYLDASDGVRTATKLARLKEDLNLSDQIVRKIEAHKREVTLRALQTIPLNHVAIEGFELLKCFGVQIAVASNSRREFVTEVLTATGLCQLVNFYLGGNQVEHPKPHPQLFTTVMDFLHVEPSDTTIFEDSAVGIQAANASGANVIYVNPDVLVTLDQIASIAEYEK